MQRTLMMAKPLILFFTFIVPLHDLCLCARRLLRGTRRQRQLVRNDPHCEPTTHGRSIRQP